jgi:hypothetical protein
MIYSTYIPNVDLKGFLCPHKQDEDEMGIYCVWDIS